MEDRIKHRSVRNLAISFVMFVIAYSLLTRFVDPTGTFGVLVAVPLWFSVELWGRKGGLGIAGAGVIINHIVYITLGDGMVTWRTSPIDMGAKTSLEVVALIAFVVIAERIQTTRLELRTSRRQEKESRELLSASEHKYQAIIELAPEGVLVVADTRIVYCNGHLSELSGYATEELIGSSFLTYLLPEDREPANALFSARLNGKALEPTNFRFRKKDGDVRWLEVIGRPMEWEGVPAVMYLLEDITDRRALEQKLFQSQKMEAIGRLAGGIAHDFNNVLQAILAYCEYINMKIEDTDSVRHSSTMIAASAERASMLTKDLLALSRKQILQPEIVELNAFLDQTVRMLGRVLGEKMSIDLDSSPDEIHVKVDPDQFQQVFLNLAVNARDAMPEGGILRLSLRSVTDEDQGSHAEITVADTGIGMDEQTLSHIFEPFFTTREQGKGTGLGLSVVSGIVEQSEGSVQVSSDIGKGTKFTICLPEVFLGASVRNTSESDDNREHRCRFILLAEDEEAVRNLVRNILGQHGYTVHAAANGEEALRLCRQGPSPDLLITDMVMPDMNGDELASTLRNELGHIEVIYITGYVDRIPELKATGAKILVKPFHIDDLIREIRDACGESE